MIKKEDLEKIKLNKTRAKILSKSIGVGKDKPIEKFLENWKFEGGIGVITHITGDPWKKNPGIKDAIYVNGFAFMFKDLELIPEEKKN